MTREEYIGAIETERFTEKLSSKLLADYPDHKTFIPDTVQHAMMLAFKRADVFKGPGHLWAWLLETCLRTMYIRIRKEKARRKLVRMTLKVVMEKSHHPYNHMDRQIDLERGIAATTRDATMRRVLTAITLQGYTVLELSTELADADTNRVAWEKRIDRALSQLRAIMRRKGYKI